jgi:hypothetical protein
VADHGDTSHAGYKEDKSVMKGTTKDECKGGMALLLKDGTAKDDTNVTKVDIHKPAQRDSQEKRIAT